MISGSWKAQCARFSRTSIRSMSWDSHRLDVDKYDSGELPWRSRDAAGPRVYARAIAAPSRLESPRAPNQRVDPKHREEMYESVSFHVVPWGEHPDPGRVRHHEDR